jgi:hypothetical protein
VFDAGGQPIANGRLPDRRDQWPRLFYHRHMMLVDQMLTDESGDSPLAGAAFRVAERLLEKHGGETIRLTLVRHNLLRPEQVKEGMKLDDPSTYEVRLVMDHRRGDQPPAPRRPGPGGEQVGIPGAAP